MTYHEDYSGLSFKSSPKEYYLIESSEKIGIFNYIQYRASVGDPVIVINSFDINCTAIGYSIEEDKFYWLKSFEEFLNTGELKVCSLTTPCHTIIRICKKQDELNASLGEFEYLLLRYSLNSSFIDTNKLKFSTRYFDLYEKYKSKIPSDFLCRKESSEYLKSKGVNIDLYTLFTTSDYNCDPFCFSPISIEESMFDDKILSRIHSSRHFLFYMRNIYKNEYLKNIWKNTQYFFTTEDYIDISIVDNQSLNRLARLTLYAPNTIEKLKGYKLSKQLEFIDKLFNKYKDDPIVGISILEKHKVEDINLDDDLCLLVLELSVRRNILEDKTNKVGKIFEQKINPIDNVFSI
jgi:hypothetical protein